MEVIAVNKPLFINLIDYFLSKERDRLTHLWGNDYRMCTTDILKQEVNSRMKDLEELFEKIKNGDNSVSNEAIYELLKRL
jgi:hypothetical protein